MSKVIEATHNHGLLYCKYKKHIVNDKKGAQHMKNSNAKKRFMLTTSRSLFNKYHTIVRWKKLSKQCSCTLHILNSCKTKQETAIQTLTVKYL